MNHFYCMIVMKKKQLGVKNLGVKITLVSSRNEIFKYNLKLLVAILKTIRKYDYFIKGLL